MTAVETVSVPEVTFSPEVHLAYEQRTHLQGALAYLAYKLKKPVVVRKMDDAVSIDELPHSTAQVVIWLSERPMSIADMAVARHRQTIKLHLIGRTRSARTSSACAGIS